MSEKPVSKVGWMLRGWYSPKLVFGPSLWMETPDSDKKYYVRVRVTEEPEPFHIEDSLSVVYVMKRENVGASVTFWKGLHPNAKEAAEAECARLNREAEPDPCE